MSSTPQQSIPSGYYYLTRAADDIAPELSRVAKRSMEVFVDESGSLVGRV